jgi:hypothetical protein
VLFIQRVQNEMKSMEGVQLREIVKSDGNYVPNLNVHCESCYGMHRQMFRLQHAQFRSLAFPICELYK